jgi:hypothetical protein
MVFVLVGESPCDFFSGVSLFIPPIVSVFCLRPAEIPCTNGRAYGRARVPNKARFKSSLSSLSFVSVGRVDRVEAIKEFAAQSFEVEVSLDLRLLAA